MSAAEVLRLDSQRARRLLDELPRAVSEGLRPNVERLYRFLGCEWVELQSLNGRGGNPRFPESRYAHARSAAEVVSLAQKAEAHHAPGLYVIGNEIDGAVTTREESRGVWVTAQKGASTTDADIARRKVGFVDIDAERARGASATDEEKAHAHAVAGRVLEFVGAVVPLASIAVGDSGNGFSVLFAADMPNTPEVENETAGLLCAFDLLFSTDRAKIDRSVKDAKRLIPLYGTMKRKGAPGIPERPHRSSALVCSDRVERIGFEDLVRLVDTAADRLPADKRAEVDKARGRKVQKAADAPQGATDTPFSRAREVPVDNVLSWLGLLDAEGPRCPGCGSRDTGVAVVGNGLKCSHNRCSQKGAKDGFRTTVDLVAEARGVTPRDAVVAMADRFGFEAFAPKNKTAQTATSEPRTPYAADAGKPFELVGPGHGLWAPLEPITYVVAGLIPHASVTLLAGYSSSLKSWLAAEMAFSVGAGRAWLGHEPFATDRGPVSYLEKEAGLYEIRRRLHAIRTPIDMPEDPLLDVCSFPAHGNVFDPEFRKRLEALAAERRMIVIDTLAAFSHGADENTAQMAEGVGLFAEIASRTKCAFVVVAHEKKKGNSGADIDPRERVRGSSAIFGAVDCVFSCQREKVREPVTVEQTKARNGREAEPFEVAMVDAHGGVTFEVRSKSEPRTLTPQEQFEELVERVVEVVRDNPRCSGNFVRGLTRVAKARTDAALERALADGKVRNLGTTKVPAYVIGEVRR